MMNYALSIWSKEFFHYGQGKPYKSFHPWQAGESGRLGPVLQGIKGVDAGIRNIVFLFQAFIDRRPNEETIMNLVDDRMLMS